MLPVLVLWCIFFCFVRLGLLDECLPLADRTGSNFMHVMLDTQQARTSTSTSYYNLHGGSSKLVFIACCEIA